jgi:multiple sugar transport system ATP-binding protein
MAYFEITGLAIQSEPAEFGSTVALELEQGRGLTVLADNANLPNTLADAVTGKRNFSGEIILNNMRIDPMPQKNRKVAVLGDKPGIIPGRTVKENLESALKSGNPALSEEVFLIEQELTEGPLTGLGDMPALSLDEYGKTILAATRILMAGCDLMIIRKLPVPTSVGNNCVKFWNPGLQLDTLLSLKNLLRRFRATWINLLPDPACVQILSDKLAIFYQNQLIQDGSLRECINAPASRLVADFLAFPSMNYRKASVEVDGPYVMLRSGRYGFRVSEYARRHLLIKENEDIVLGIRPEDIGVRPYETGDPSAMNLAKIIRVDSIPGALIVRIDTEGVEWIALTEPGRALFTGQLIELRPNPDKIHLFHSHTGTNILD